MRKMSVRTSEFQQPPTSFRRYRFLPSHPVQCEQSWSRPFCKPKAGPGQSVFIVSQSWVEKGTPPSLDLAAATARTTSLGVGVLGASIWTKVGLRQRGS